jgi:probable rRNA maturation factor
MAVSVTVRGGAPVNRPQVRRLVRAILADHGHSESDVSVLFVTDAEIRRLNLEYRKKDRPTDVLSFWSGGSSVVAEEAETVLGDVVISTDRAAVQARRFRRTFDREILKLTAHGVLHLLGLDHERPGERTEMRRLENRYVRDVSGNGGTGR